MKPHEDDDVPSWGAMIGIALVFLAFFLAVVMVA